MGAMKQLNCMFDTNVFNRILDAEIQFQPPIDRVLAFATHIQRDEINSTKNLERRTALAKIFNDIVLESTPTDSFVLGVSRIGEARLGGDRVVPTESAIWGVSKWDQAKWGDSDDLYSRLKAELDKLNKNKPNNTQDALIGETSIKGGYVLVTDDADLAAVTKKYGGKCLSVIEFSQECAR